MRFEDFLDAELEGLGRYSQVLTGERQKAHDILAEAMIKVQLHWQRVGSMAYPLAYVRRILTNQFLEERRSWAGRMLRPMEPETIPQQPVWDRDPKRLDDRSELHDLLASLPKQQRAAIVLRHYLDLTDAEIADALSCSEGAVRTYISRGLAALRLRDSVEAPSQALTAAPTTRMVNKP